MPAPTPASKGFGGLSKTTAKTQPPVQAAVSTPPQKTKAQLLREEAEAMERAEAAQTVQAEPEVLRVETEIPASNRQLTNPFQNLLAQFSGAQAVNSLSTWHEESERSTFEHPFPVVQISGGESGGAFVTPDWQSEDISIKVPQGRRPLSAVFLGYRLEALFWGKEYDKNAEKAAAPIATAIIPGTNEADIKLLTRASKAYQFTAKANKSKFNVGPDLSGSGHVRPTFEVLVFSPDVGGLLVIRTVSLYGSVTSSIQTLAKHVDPASKSLKPFPAMIRVETIQESSKGGNAWPNHFLDFTVDVTATGKKAFADAMAWNQSVGDDQETMTKINEWLSGGNLAIKDSERARLNLALSL